MTVEELNQDQRVEVLNSPLPYDRQLVDTDYVKRNGSKDMAIDATSSLDFEYTSNTDNDLYIKTISFFIEADDINLNEFADEDLDSGDGVTIIHNYKGSNITLCSNIQCGIDFFRYMNVLNEHQFPFWHMDKHGRLNNRSSHDYGIYTFDLKIPLHIRKNSADKLIVRIKGEDFEDLDQFNCLVGAFMITKEADSNE